MISRRFAEQGATALLVVVFSVLLLVTVSVGFMRLVVQDQERTTNDELSRGAYDSAIAGVEDGKRVLQACVTEGSAVACEAIRANECNTVFASRILSASHSSSDRGEVMLRNSTGTDGGFDQAYTCVKVSRDTEDYERTLTTGVSQIVPLQTAGPFSSIRVSWFLNPNNTPVDLGGGTSTPLPTTGAWSPAGQVRPSLLRVQLIQFNRDSYQLADFDANGGGHTLYLYPSLAGADNDIGINFGTDNRRTASTDGLLKAVRCTTAITSTYLCNVQLDLPAPVGGTEDNRQAYLRVTSIYGDTDFSVRPVNTLFRDVEPSIDSTGRAANVFRRVKARVQMISTMDTQLYPRATVDITHNFCKDFGVTPTLFQGDATCYAGP